MANDIAAFFESEPERAVTLDGIAGHIKRFWDPRMRRELLVHLDERGGEGLRETVIAALRAHRDRVEPAAPSAPSVVEPGGGGRP